MVVGHIYCQAQSKFQLNWAEVALLSLYYLRNYRNSSKKASNGLNFGQLLNWTNLNNLSKNNFSNNLNSVINNLNIISNNLHNKQQHKQQLKQQLKQQFRQLT